MEEIWKDISGYEGLYQVSNTGKVKSLDRIITRKNGVQQKYKGIELKQAHNKRVNVYEVNIYLNGKRKCMKVHRLVAEAFVENDDPVHKTTVNHKDGKRENNAYTNLEWATYSENEKHAYDKLHRPINSTSVKKRRCKAINKILNTITEYDSIEAASRGTGISSTQIRRICKGECVNEQYEFVIDGIK